MKMLKMKSAFACLSSELEFIFSYTLLLVVTIAALYNVTQDIQIEFSKFILSLVLGVVVPNPKLKQNQQSPINNQPT